MPITTTARVRARLNIQDWEASDTNIDQFISDAEASIENYIGSLPASGAGDYALAGSIATDFAAYYTGISLPQPPNPDEAKARREKVQTIKSSADFDLARLLTKPGTIPLPKSTTQ